MIGRLQGIVIDCPDPSGLASFYEELLGMIRVQDDGDEPQTAVLHLPPG